MTPEDFLTDYEAHFAWSRPDGVPASMGLAPIAGFTGRGTHPLEVALGSVSRRPRADEVRRTWIARYGKAPNPLLLVAAYQEDGDWKASICGPVGDEPPVESGLELSEVERIAAAALAQPSRHAAIRFLGSIWAELENELPGLRNQGMFATHELRDGVPSRRDWNDACAQGRALLGHRGRDLVERLGFSIGTHATAASVLSIAGTKRAIAVFLDEGEDFETSADRFSGTSPISHALALADRESLPWVVLTRGRQIRVYAARTDTGVGRKGRSETFIEANLALLPDDRAGYVALLFSADALKDGGTFDEVLVEHLLAGEETVSPERGLFLGITWRMHPTICEFVSEMSYEGRLRSVPECAGNNVNGESGLRFIPVEHVANRQQSREEAEIVRGEVERLHEAGLPYQDVLVVAPYNAQVRCLRSVLPDPVRVGTVDKFQGQEAPVVIFSMATSSGDDLVRSIGFLFSRNRLNVAVSRAKALAILVASPKLLEIRCRTIEDMRLVNALCRFVEMAAKQRI